MHFCHVTTFYPPHSFGGDAIGLQRLCHALAHYVDQFIAMGRFSRAKHAEFGFPAPMRVMPHLIPDADIAARHGRRPPPDTSPHPRPYFLFVGRLETVTGVDSLLPAFAQYADADLLIVGDGHERRPLETAARGNPRVHFLGRLDQERLAHVYGAAIALIVPSVGYETFGLTLIESFLHSTPVIARRLGPFPEIIEKSRGGELFENTDELLSAMCGFSLIRSAPHSWRLRLLGRSSILVRKYRDRGIHGHFQRRHRTALHKRTQLAGHRCGRDQAGHVGPWGRCREVRGTAARGTNRTTTPEENRHGADNVAGADGPR